MALGRRYVDTVVAEQGQAVGEPVLGRQSTCLRHICSRFHGRTEPAFPRARGRVGQTMGEQQAQVRVVGAEHPVVQGLLIRRVRPPALQ